MRAGVTLLSRCRGCHAPASRLEEVLAMEPMPLAGEFSRTEAEARAAACYPLTWVRCPACHLVQVREDVDDDALFRTYNYASSSVPGLVRHFEGYAKFLQARYGLGPLRLVEIGCNDGVLLSRLPTSWRRAGFDPSDVARERKSGDYELINAPFTEARAREHLGPASVDVVTASNCLAHIADLRGIFEGVRAALRPGGEFWLEVHDLEATLALGQWDTIYHEHKAEWSVGALDRCLGPLGFERFAAERLPLHGGLLRVGYRAGAPSSDFAPSPEGLPRLREAYLGRRATPVYRAIAEAAERGERLAAYGAAGRANVWLNQLPELPFRYILDDSPLRMHKWIPKVALPILPSPHLAEEPVGLCVITAWNYAADIRAKHPGFAGRWLQTFSEEG